DTEALFAALRDHQRAPDADLPATGVPLELERGLSSAFVQLPSYGTRASTVAWIRDDDSWGFIERRFGSNGAVDEVRFESS
ncbi:MAG: NRDE family protein, partial [Myxococcales bacterium]|nr:NRDE family protein [Myxococcales bacterium]